MRVFATPSAANSNAHACRTLRCDAVVDLANVSRVDRWPSASSKAAAAWFITRHQHNNQTNYETLH